MAGAAFAVGFLLVAARAILVANALYSLARSTQATRQEHREAFIVLLLAGTVSFTLSSLDSYRLCLSLGTFSCHLVVCLSP